MSKVAFMTMDVESMYDAVCIKRYGIEYNSRYSCEEAINDYLNLLDEFNIKGTFFTLASSLDKAKPILNMAIEKGHEIALHGLNHDSPLAMSKNEFIRNISKAKHKLEHELNIKIKGYRAPCFGINDDLVTALKDLGFKYDSSNLNFSLAHDSGAIDLSEYNQKNDLVYKDNEFYEFNPALLKFKTRYLPISGGGYLRLIPWIFIKPYVKKYIKTHNCYMFYVHPFEIYSNKLPSYKELNLYERLYMTINRKRYLSIIRKLIKLLIKNNYEFMTMNQYRKKERKI